MDGIDLSKLPPPHVLFGPAAFIGSMPPLPRHPNMRSVHKAGTRAIELLEQVVAVRVTDFKLQITESYDPALDEPVRAILEAARSTVPVLQGTRARVFERDLSRFVPHLASTYVRLSRQAVDRLNELRAVLAFFLGASDDEELGYQFVPPPPPPGEAPEASVSLDLG